MKNQGSDEKRKLSIARSVEMVVVKPFEKHCVDSACGMDDNEKVILIID